MQLPPMREISSSLLQNFIKLKKKKKTQPASKIYPKLNAWFLTRENNSKILKVDSFAISV